MFLDNIIVGKWTQGNHIVTSHGNLRWNCCVWMASGMGKNWSANRQFIFMEGKMAHLCGEWSQKTSKVRSISGQIAFGHDWRADRSERGTTAGGEVEIFPEIESDNEETQWGIWSSILPYTCMAYLPSKIIPKN